MTRLLLLGLLAAPGCALVLAPGEGLRGSGKLATQEFKLNGFTAVDVSSSFEVDIVRAAAFKVEVTADDNALEHVQVKLDGTTLKIGLEQGKSYNNCTFKAVVTMPALEAVQLTGACQGTIQGFKSNKPFKVAVQGASGLKGEMEAAELDADASGASTVKLKGTAKKAILKATGASTLSLGSFALDHADVALTGASGATVEVKEALDYRLNGASSLKYKGNPKVGQHVATGASSATHE